MNLYQIGDVFFSYTSDEYNLISNSYMEPFRVCKDNTEAANADTVIYEIWVEDLAKYGEGKLIQRNGLNELYEIGDDRILIYHWKTCRFAFGVFLNDLETKNRIPCYISREIMDWKPLNASKLLCSLGLHLKLLQKGGIVFHASFIEWKGTAVLFAGPSGTGKSTQAELWRKNEHAEIINGDRVLLRKKGKNWCAYGYPSCGSSDICLNKTFPIKAIVLLEQGEKNKTVNLKTIEKYRAMITGTEMYLWNEKEIEMASGIVSELIQEVNIIKYECTADVYAVQTLKKILEEME